MPHYYQGLYLFTGAYHTACFSKGDGTNTSMMGLESGFDDADLFGCGPWRSCPTGYECMVGVGMVRSLGPLAFGGGAPNSMLWPPLPVRCLDHPRQGMLLGLTTWLCPSLRSIRP